MSSRLDDWLPIVASNRAAGFLREWLLEHNSQTNAPELVTIRQFGDIAEALLAQGCLEAAGIECFLADLNIARVDWPLSRGIRLQVAPGDAADAVEVMDQPPLEEGPE